MTGTSKRSLDLAAIKGYAPIVTLMRALCQQQPGKPLRRIGNADFVQNVKSGPGDLCALGITQRSIAAALEIRMRIAYDRLCWRLAASIAVFCVQSSFQTVSRAIRKILSASLTSDLSIISGGMKLIRSGGIDRK